MPDWQSPQELALDATVFMKFMHAILGLYAWEWFLSVDFDWDFLTMKKKFRWPMIFYFANRYILLFALIGIIIALDTTVKINCQVLYTFNQIAGDAALGLASINLSLRTIAVYSNSKWIIGLLTLVILGHWSLILQGVLLTAEWSDELGGCVILSSDNKILAATFIYSMAFDLLVFLLNAWALVFRKRKGGDSITGLSKLTRMIFSDGLIYFFIAFISNLVATVFMLLSLNAIMTIIFNVPAAVANTIVACRVVRRLSNFKNSHEVFSSHSQSRENQFKGVNAGSVMSRSRNAPSNGVHVQMETFTHAEEASLPPPAQKAQYVRYIEEGRKNEVDSYTDDEETKPPAL